MRWSYLTLFFCCMCAGLEAWIFSCSPPFWEQRCCRFEVGGEYLYMRPSRCDLAYAVLDPRPYVGPTPPTPQAFTSTEVVAPVGRIKFIRPNYQSGFRVAFGTAIQGGCFDARAVYTRVHTSTTHTLTPAPPSGGIWASELINSNVNNPGGSPSFSQLVLFNPTGLPTLVEAPAVVRAKAEFDYDAGEFQLAMRSTFGCGVWLRGAIGLHFAYIDGIVTINYLGTAHPGQPVALPFTERVVRGPLSRTSTAWGLGPRVSVEGSYEIYCGFGIAGRVGMTLITGRRDAGYKLLYSSTNAFPPQDVFELRLWNVHTPHEPFTAPGLDARLGASYVLCFGKYHVKAEVGYEWLTYIDTLPTGPRFRMDRGISTEGCATFSLDGLYVSILVSL